MRTTRGDIQTAGFPALSERARLAWPRDADDEASAVLRALQRSDWSAGAAPLKREGGSFTCVVGLESGDRVVVKRIADRAGVIGAVRAVLPNRRGARHVRGALLVAAAGVRVGKPLLLAREPGAEWLVVEHIEGRDALRTLAERRLSSVDAQCAATAIGRAVRRLADAGVFNRDMKLSNIVLAPGGEVALIDTPGVRRARGLAVRMLEPMVRELAGVGLTPSRALRMRCLRAATDDPRKAWRALEASLRSAGDTRPRTDPLAERAEKSAAGVGSRGA